MGRKISRAAVTVALIGLGWVLGRAQASQPDFELIVNAPAGETTVQCARGCDLVWVERGINPNAMPMPTFTFACRGERVERCSSARIGGWVKK